MDLIRGKHRETAIIFAAQRLSASGSLRVTVADTVRNCISVGPQHLIVIQLHISRRLGCVIANAANTLLTFVDIRTMPRVKTVLGQIKPVFLIRLIMPFTRDTKDTALRYEVAI